MKRLFLILLVSLLFVQSYAQKDKKKVPNLPMFDQKLLHFGFTIGFNTMNFNVLNTGVSTIENGNNPRYAELISLVPGINLGIVSSLRIAKNFNLRVLPGISFGQRDLSYIDHSGVVDERVLQIKSTFIEMPIMIKYGSNRINNFKPYVVAGFNPRYDLAKNKRDGLLLKSLDYYWEFGVGYDAYLNYFRLSTEFKVSLGMRNMLDKKGTGNIEDIPYTQAIDKLTSRIFVLSFYFE